MLKQDDIKRIQALANGRSNNGERKGQALMNILATEYKEVSDLIHGTEADCFYEDKKIKNFWNKLFSLLTF